MCINALRLLFPFPSPPGPSFNGALASVPYALRDQATEAEVRVGQVESTRGFATVTRRRAIVNRILLTHTPRLLPRGHVPCPTTAETRPVPVHRHHRSHPCCSSLHNANTHSACCC